MQSAEGVPGGGAGVNMGRIARNKLYTTRDRGEAAGCIRRPH